MTTVLVPSAGGPGCVNLTRSLHAIDGVETVGFDASPHYLHLAETNTRLLGPRRDAPGFRDFVNEVVSQHGVDFIFPNNSLDGAWLTRNASHLAAPVFLPSARAFDVGENKWETYQLLIKLGIPAPGTLLVDSPQDLEEALDLFGSPIWVRGSGIPGKGVGVASLPAANLHQATAWVDYWNGWGKMAASQFLPGDNLTWLGVFDGGKLVASQGRQRDAYVIPHVSPSGITGAPAISHTVHRGEINTLGPQVCLAADPHFTGPAFVDFKGNEAGEPQVTEINVGRFGTTHHFYTVAGCNFPQLVLSLAMGLEIPGWAAAQNVLAPDLFWVRTLDAGPALVTATQLKQLSRSGRIP